MKCKDNVLRAIFKDDKMAITQEDESLSELLWKIELGLIVDLDQIAVELRKNLARR